MAYFKCKELGQARMSDYAEYILICNCDIGYNISSYWDIRQLKPGNKFLLIVNNIYMKNPTQHIIVSNEYGYNFLKTMIGIFNTLEEAIAAFNNNDILSYYPYSLRDNDYYYLYYGGYSWGWDFSLPYYASKTFNLNFGGHKYEYNPHPAMKPKI